MYEFDYAYAVKYLVEELVRQIISLEAKIDTKMAFIVVAKD